MKNPTSINDNIIPINESFKELLIENNYAIYEQGFHKGVEIFKAEKEFESDHISFYFYIDTQLEEMKYTTIKRIPIEVRNEKEI